MSAPQSAKLVLLGESAVGKSSLVLQFVRGEFSDFRESTIGAAFLTQTVQIAGKDGSPPRTLKFEIWDTAGQERYKSLAPIYYRNATASLVVYDITSPPSFEKAKTWIRDLRRQADPGLVILLCGNKKDLPGREVSTETGEAYAKEEGLLFLEASAKSGEGVKEIFDLIAETLPAPTPKPTAGGTGAAAGGVNLAAGAGGDGAGAKDGCAC